jgi:hypothetical protein
MYLMAFYMLRLSSLWAVEFYVSSRLAFVLTAMGDCLVSLWGAESAISYSPILMYACSSSFSRGLWETR